MLSVNVHARSCVSRSLSWLLLAPRKIIERSVDEAANSDIVDKLVAEL